MPKRILCCLVAVFVALISLCPYRAWALEELAAPNLLSPFNGMQFVVSDFQEGNIVLKWSSVPGAVSYFLQVKGPNLYNPQDELDGNGQFDKTVFGTQFTLTNSTLAGEYTWWVQAKDASGALGSPSVPWRMLVFQSSLPTDTPTVPYPRYDINGDKVVDARDLACFALGEWTDQNPDLRCDVDWDGKVDADDLLLLLRNWSVRANLVPTPTPTSFLSAPVLLFPEDNALLPIGSPPGLIFRWYSVAGAGGYRFQLRFDSPNMASFTEVFETSKTEVLWKHYSTSGAGFGWWKVCAIEPDGDRGPWSEEWGFEIPTPTPTPSPTPLPDSSMPADINRDQTVNSTDLFSLALVWKQASSSTKFNYSADLTGDGVIDARDILLVLKDFRLNTPGPGAVTLVYPGQNQSVRYSNLQSPGLQWQAIQGVTRYHVHVDDPTGRYPRDLFISGTSTPLGVTTLGQYRWRVRAFEPEIGTWSAVRAFRFVQ